MLMHRAVTAIVLPRLSPPSLSCSRFCMGNMSKKRSPICPKFIPVEGSDIHSRSKPDGFRFSLISYNILAQVYIKSSYFPHSPAPSLRWKARSQAILTVLKELGADIFCLQEVDEYDSFYKAIMEKHGYSSIYIKRTGQKCDGCGIFYKQDRAELVVEEKIEYNDLVNLIEGMENTGEDMHSVEVSNANADAETTKGSELKKSLEDHGDPNDPRVRLKRDCVGVMAAFKLSNRSRHLVIVANTHIYWDPEWADVKLAQAKYLLSRLAQFKSMVSDKFDCVPPVVLAGDFNSTPGDKVYQYVVSGGLSTVIPECIDERPMPLQSVYASTRGEPPFTNCTPGFTGTLDYIFFSPDANIRPISFLELPESNSPDVVDGLPNYYYPSDHLPIGCEFEIVEE